MGYILNQEDINQEDVIVDIIEKCDEKLPIANGDYLCLICSSWPTWMLGKRKDGSWIFEPALPPEDFVKGFIRLPDEGVAWNEVRDEDPDIED